MAGPRSLSRRDLLRLGGAALGGGFAGCQSVGGGNRQPARTAAERTDPTTTATAVPQPQSTTAATPTRSVTRPEWVADRLNGPPLRPPNTPAGTLAAVLSVGSGSGNGVRGVFVENKLENQTKIFVSVENKGKTTELEPTIPPGAFVAVGLYGPADYAVTVTADGHEASFDVPRSQYDCNDYLTVVTISASIDVETYHTDEFCGTTTAR